MRIKKRTDIGIIVSVPPECSMLVRKLKKDTQGDGLWYAGRLAGKAIVLVLSGVGKVNASHAATRLIHDHNPSLVMNLGIGGAYPSSGLNTGDIAVAEREIYGDEGILLRDGFHGTGLIGIPLVKKGRKKYFNEFPLDNTLVKKAFAASVLTPYSSRRGVFVTVSACSGTKRRAVEIEKKFHAICENMEGAAIAHICALYGIPVIEMRGISNIVEDRDLKKWNIRLAAENCQKAAMSLIKEL